MQARVVERCEVMALELPTCSVTFCKIDLVLGYSAHESRLGYLGITLAHSRAHPTKC